MIPSRLAAHVADEIVTEVLSGTSVLYLRDPVAKELLFRLLVEKLVSKPDEGFEVSLAEAWVAAAFNRAGLGELYDSFPGHHTIRIVVWEDDEGEYEVDVFS